VVSLKLLTNTTTLTNVSCICYECWGRDSTSL